MEWASQLHRKKCQNVHAPCVLCFPVLQCEGGGWSHSKHLKERPGVHPTPTWLCHCFCVPCPSPKTPGPPAALGHRVYTVASSVDTGAPVACRQPALPPGAFEGTCQLPGPVSPAHLIPALRSTAGHLPSSWPWTVSQAWFAGLSCGTHSRRPSGQAECQSGNSTAACPASTATRVTLS